MRTKLLTFSILIIPIFLSCCTAKNTVASYNSEYQIFIGKSIQDAEKQSSIMFDSVVSDSRCPKGVQCIWEGEAVVKFKVTAKNGTSKTYEIKNGEGAVTDWGYKIMFIDLIPYPKADKEVKKEAYKAKIKLVKL